VNWFLLVKLGNEQSYDAFFLVQIRKGEVVNNCLIPCLVSDFIENTMQ